MISVCIHVLPCVNASSHAQTYPVHVLETGGQSSLTRLNTVYRKTCLKESLEAEKQTLGQMDSSHGNECSLERGTSKTISRKGKLRSSKRWLTPPKDSGAIKRHLHWGISVWTLVWEESSVCARITGIQLLRALVRSFQLSGLHVSWAFSELLHRWCSGGAALSHDLKYPFSNMYFFYCLITKPIISIVLIGYSLSITVR